MALLLDLTPLRSAPAYRRLWLGLSVSNLGTQFTVTAVGLQVYAITGSTLSVGVLGVCALVPLVLLGLYGGALVDQYDRRRVAIIASVGLWVVSGLLALQAWLHLDSVGLLYALVALQSAGFAVNNPARSAIIPRLVEPDLLPAANVLQTVSWNVAFVVGPLLGAFMVAGGDFGLAYTVDVVLFTAALWALLKLPDLPPAETATGEPGRRGLASVLEGLRYLATRPNVRMTFVVDLTAMILAMPRVLLPAVGVLWLGGGAATTGGLSAAFAVGAVLAGLLSGGLVRVRHQGRVIASSIVVFGLAVAGFGAVLLGVGRTSPGGVLVPALLASFVLLAVAGGADAVSAVFRQTILQAATPDEMRGRLQGVFIVVVAGGPRLGDLVLGSGAERFGEGLAALAGGLLCAVVLVAVVAVQRRFWDYDARDPQP
ncbi:MFS-type transporter involved in bile tolerance, Atg22 family [Microlunatus sagamiharensis]|uniref:MFS-type transporter involved in bile tolerance, Atg22 family n=1 Tax=Microlunatus sagamiharensis TaxID=546874 RepID=A0A1H2N403_9ACTN|nr:MFS transporter [Microlunatus sagamiharensis]SDU99881.1 MFS-type transporter involved in bile tolerance, Atg22 family [Microlunatus sagamiharensis]